ncbi:MAG: peptidyl-prolyl cis-trans isomerase [Holophagales bacterium]|nr:peptidyl-prolyl cis-trans isomerase [Holophagales bacterium]
MLLLIAATLAACARAPRVPTDAAVSIDGEEIPYSQFESFVRQQVDQDGLELDTVGLSTLFDQFLDEQLLVRLAIERGLVEGEVDERRALAFLLRDSRRHWSDMEIEAYYRSHRQHFERPEQVRLRQILVHEQATAEEALAALAAGESFEEVAARFSQGPTAHLGGDQGTLSRDDLVPKFGELLFELEPGATTGIVEADYGLQIFQVVERLPATVVPLEQAEPEIHRQLERGHLDEQVETLRAEARERYNVTVFRPNIPFDYRGSHEQSYEP